MCKKMHSDAAKGFDAPPTPTKTRVLTGNNVTPLAIVCVKLILYDEPFSQSFRGSKYEKIETFR